MNPMGTAVIRPKKSQKPIASRSTWVCSSMCMSVNSSQDGHSKTGLRVFERVSLGHHFCQNCFGNGNGVLLTKYAQRSAKLTPGDTFDVTPHIPAIKIECAARS